MICLGGSIETPHNDASLRQSMRQDIDLRAFVSAISKVNLCVISMQVMSDVVISD